MIPATMLAASTATNPPVPADASTAGPAAGPFTALLTAALGETTPAVAQVIDDLQQAVQAQEGEETDEDLPPDALADAVAAMAAAGALPLPLPLAQVQALLGRLPSGQGAHPHDVPVEGGAVQPDTAAAAPADGVDTGAAPAATVPGEALVTAGREATPVSAAPAISATTPAATGEPIPAGMRPVVATPAPVPAPDVDTASTDVSSPAPTVSATAAPVTAATGASPAAPTADMGLHARIVARVIEAADVLENAPPPRTMVVELPDSDGIRLQVSLRGGEVHVSLAGGQAGSGSPDLGAWGRELAAGLASRGMTLGGFATGSDGHTGRQPGEHAPDQPHPSDDRPPTPRPTRRPARRADGLRL